MNSLSFFNPAITNDLFEALDRGLSSFTSPSANGRFVNAPRVDIMETKDAYILEAELPGMTEKDISLNIKERVLTLASTQEQKTEETRTEQKEDSTEYLLRERRCFNFVRRFSLPVDANPQQVSAKFKNGVLTVTLAKQAEIAPQTIMIETA